MTASIENTKIPDFRDGVMTLESMMLGLAQIDIPPVHHFADGIYAREIFIPKGTLLTGKIHKTAHINIISKGDITVMTEDGSLRITAPHTFVAQPGTKRIGYANEDTVWTTIHASVETELDKLEEELIYPDYQSALSGADKQQIEGV